MAKINKKMSIGEVVTKYPKSVGVMLKYGLHCVGCSVAAWESLDDGAKRHGLSDKDIDKMISEINKLTSKTRPTKRAKIARRVKRAKKKK